MNKGDFSNQSDYEAAMRNRQYAGQEHIDAKIASMCLRDSVANQGDTPDTIGACPLADECNYANDKFSGVSGFCMKQAVGVELRGF